MESRKSGDLQYAIAGIPEAGKPGTPIDAAAGRLSWGSVIQIRPSGPPRDPDSPFRYPPGTLVRHRRYGYRGVVVAADATCRADEGWYRSNRTQPERDQPWYHVLVHDSPHTTYAAQTSLARDPLGGPVRHALVERFFSEFRDGYHVRNDRPWPGPS